jgi:hypothetical protein
MLSVTSRWPSLRQGRADNLTTLLEGKALCQRFVLVHTRSIIVARLQPAGQLRLTLAPSHGQELARSRDYGSDGDDHSADSSASPAGRWKLFFGSLTGRQPLTKG